MNRQRCLIVLSAVISIMAFPSKVLWAAKPDAVTSIPSLHGIVARGDAKQVAAYAKIRPESIHECQTVNSTLTDLPQLKNATPLHRAVLQGSADIVRVLLRAGSPVDGIAGGANTPLHLAAWAGHAEMVTILLEAGATVDRLNQHQRGFAAIHLAAMAGKTKAVQALIEGQADVGVLDGFFKATALHYSVPWNDQETAQVLLEEGADVNFKDSSGLTPLMWAAECPLTWAQRANHKVNPAIARFLLSQGADPNLTDNKGHTPLDMARKRHHVEMVAALDGEGDN